MMSDGLRSPEPIVVAHLFSQERAALLAVLRELDDEEWRRPTACAGWTVHDVALHLLGGYLGNVARRRDHWPEAELSPGADLVERLNAHNARWVEAARRLSPALTIDLLALAGAQLDAYFAEIDATAMGGGVSWAGEGPAPVWLDLAREFTEHWHHQQHIRDATGRPILDEPRFLHPVLAAFVFALPHTFSEVAAPEGTTVTLSIAGPAGGDWTIRREGKWRLFEGAPAEADARVDLPQDIAWRLFTKGIAPDDARESAILTGDQRLGARLFDTVAIIA